MKFMRITVLFFAMASTALAGYSPLMTDDTTRRVSPTSPFFTNNQAEVGRAAASYFATNNNGGVVFQNGNATNLISRPGVSGYSQQWRDINDNTRARFDTNGNLILIVGSKFTNNGTATFNGDSTFNGGTTFIGDIDVEGIATFGQGAIFSGIADGHAGIAMLNADGSLTTGYFDTLPTNGLPGYLASWSTNDPGSSGSALLSANNLWTGASNVFKGNVVIGTNGVVSNNFSVAGVLSVSSARITNGFTNFGPASFDDANATFALFFTNTFTGANGILTTNFNFFLMDDKTNAFITYTNGAKFTNPIGSFIISNGSTYASGTAFANALLVTNTATINGNVLVLGNTSMQGALNVNSIIVTNGQTNLDMTASKFVKTDANKALSSSDVNDSDVVFTDITTGNASTSSHGYLKKLPNDATKFMDGTGNWTVPAGTGGGGGGSGPITVTSKTNISFQPVYGDIHYPYTNNGSTAFVTVIAAYDDTAGGGSYSIKVTNYTDHTGFLSTMRQGNSTTDDLSYSFMINSNDVFQLVFDSNIADFIATIEPITGGSATVPETWPIAAYSATDLDARKWYLGLPAWPAAAVSTLDDGYPIVALSAGTIDGYSVNFVAGTPHNYNMSFFVTNITQGTGTASTLFALNAARTNLTVTNLSLSVAGGDKVFLVALPTNTTEQVTLTGYMRKH